jgi:AmmeMemoRadiSam system protein B
MASQFVRRAAVAGSWYPSDATALAREVDRHLRAADLPPAGDLKALIVPHAGLMYSGPVAAYAYRALENRAFDVVVLVGPSHYVPFDGVATSAADAFETPFGPLTVARDVLASLAAQSPVIHEFAPAHAREHSLEMQLPFLARLMREIPIVPLVMGEQAPSTMVELAGALARGLASRRALLIASTDLSHYHDAATASLLDRLVIDCVSRFDVEGLVNALQQNPGHACGGGPMASVLMAARILGARQAAILRYADSGDVSGDKSAVVGYMAAAVGTFDEASEEP